MIRPFAIRDVNTIRRVNGHSVPMAMRHALTQEIHPITSAMRFKITGSGYPTYVWKSADYSTLGYGQLHLPKNGTYARLTFAGVTGTDPETAWLELLDGIVIEAGKRRAHGVIAEIGETSDIFPVLRRAGFVVNTRQDIWVIQNEMPQSDILPTFTKCTEEDDWDVQILYANLTPPLVRMVEPIPSIAGHEIWVLKESGEIVAYVDLFKGNSGTWIQLYIHPNAETEADSIVASMTRLGNPTNNRPLFICVRRYQSWLGTALEKAGYAHHSSQAVMVKHTVKMKKHKPKEINEILEQNPAMAKPSTFVHNYEPPTT